MKKNNHFWVIALVVCCVIMYKPLLRGITYAFESNSPLNQDWIALSDHFQQIYSISNKNEEWPDCNFSLISTNYNETYKSSFSRWSAPTSTDPRQIESENYDMDVERYLTILLPKTCSFKIHPCDSVPYHVNNTFQNAFDNGNYNRKNFEVTIITLNESELNAYVILGKELYSCQDKLCVFITDNKQDLQDDSEYLVRKIVLELTLDYRDVIKLAEQNL